MVLSELEVVMRSTHRDPWGGEFVTAMTHLSRGEPPAVLFDIPERYKVVDAESEAEHHVLDLDNQTPVATAK